MSKPQRLPYEIKTNGHLYELFRRTDLIACYKQFDGDLLVGYEIFEIPVRKEETIKGVTYKCRETFPSTSSFGVNAWTLGAYCTEEQVIERFDQLDKKVREGLKDGK